MLPKKHRVSKKIFDETFHHGRSFNGTHSLLKILIIKGKEPARVSFVVSKKVAKGAVERNILRRRGYYTIHKIKDSLDKGVVAIFILKSGVQKLSFQEFEKEIHGLLEKSSSIV